MTRQEQIIHKRRHENDLKSILKKMFKLNIKEMQIKHLSGGKN